MISSPKIKKVLIFSQKRFFIYFRKQNFFNKKTSCISGGHFPSSKNKKNDTKKCPIFREME